MWVFFVGICQKYLLTPPTTFENMQEQIIAACREVTADILAHVDDSFKTRIRMCIQENDRRCFYKKKKHV